MNNDVDRRFVLGGLTAAAGISALTAMARTASAGPLDPPAGAVASTSKPLAEVEPRTAINAANTPGSASAVFIITQPGSYYLTGNINAGPLKSGVVIQSPDVTLDLCGFAISGTASSPAGIQVSNSGSGRTVIRNGHIRGFQFDGVNLALSGTAPLCTVEDLVLSGNGSTNGAGVRTNSGSGQGGVVIRRCMAIGNFQGISVDKAGTIEDCAAYGNSDAGIFVSERCVVRRCTAMNNALYGVQAVTRCRLSGNTCVHNGTTGAPSSGGISAGAACVLEDNLCDTNFGYGYLIGSTNLYVRNVAQGNTVVNWSVNVNNRGQVIQAPTASGIFSGNAGGNALAASGYDPNANFTY